MTRRELARAFRQAWLGANHCRKLADEAPTQNVTRQLYRASIEWRTTALWFAECVKDKTL